MIDVRPTIHSLVHNGTSTTRIVQLPENTTKTRQIRQLIFAYVPLEWRTAHIVPVHKKGTTGDVNNYRPISLTCVASEILERIVANRILDYLVSNNILHSAQHEFMKRRSTCTNLLDSVNDWTLCVQTKQQVSIAYVDFSKAFDVVSHSKLFTRLHAYGIFVKVFRYG